MGAPPGPQEPSAVQTAAFLRRQPEFLDDCRRKYGSVFTVTIFERPLVVVADPGLCAELIKWPGDLAWAGAANGVLEPTIGPGSILLLDGSRHRERRKLVAPRFHGAALDGRAERVRERTEALLESLPVDEPVRLRLPLRDLSVDLMLEFIFGRLDEETHGALKKALLKIRFPEGRATARRVVGEIVAGTQRSSRDDFDQPVAHFLRGHPAMVQEEIVDELLGILIAGYDAPANGLAWVFERLVRHPDAWEQVRVEDGSEHATAIVKEALRMRPPLPFAARRLVEPLTLGPFALPAGVDVGASLYLAHRDPDVYPDPDAFRPQRFLGGETPAVWIPFGGGGRRCLGASLALTELTTVVKTVVPRVRMRPTSPEPEDYVRRGVAFVPSRDVSVVVSAISAESSRADQLAAPIGG